MVPLNSNGYWPDQFIDLETIGVPSHDAFVQKHPASTNSRMSGKAHLEVRSENAQPGNASFPSRWEDEDRFG